MGYSSCRRSRRGTELLDQAQTHRENAVDRPSTPHYNVPAHAILCGLYLLSLIERAPM